MKITELLSEDVYFLMSLRKIDPEMYKWFQEADVENLNSGMQIRVFRLKREKIFRESMLDESFNTTKNTILDNIFTQLDQALHFTDEAENIRNSLNYDRITCEALLNPLLMKTFVSQLQFEPDKSIRNLNMLNFKVTQKFLQELNKSETQQKLVSGELKLSFKNINLRPMANTVLQPSTNNNNQGALEQQHMDDKKAAIILTSFSNFAIHDPLKVLQRSNIDQMMTPSADPTDTSSQDQQFELNR